MESRSRDTSADAERVQVELVREMPGWRKFALVSDALRTSRRLAYAGLRDRYPEDTPDQLRRRLRALVLGDEVAARIWGPVDAP